MSADRYNDRLEAMAAERRRLEAFEDDAVWRMMRWLIVGCGLLIVALGVWL